MHLRIFTLPFDELSEGFPDEVISEFCLNKKVHKVQTKFFQHDGRPFWSVAVQYEMVVKGEEKLRELNEGQKLLFDRMKEWRKKRAEKDGIPVYLIATNIQLLTMIRLKTLTLESFKQVKGFGQKRVQKYGKEIVDLIKAFYENQKQNETKESDEQEPEKLPF